jgi:hypothetical protein
MDSAMSHGARPINTNSLPVLKAKWHYKSDADGVQIYLDGDYFPQVRSFLLAAFGPPAIPVRTNRNGRILGAYAAPAIGAAIQFGREDARDGTRRTQIVIVHRNALKL